MLSMLAVASLRADTPKGPSDDTQQKTAYALEQQGKNVEAEAAWRAVLKQQPTNAEAYAHLGLLEARQERYAEAVPLYRKASALDPAMPGLQMNLGLSLFKSGALKDAITTFESLLKDEPSSSPEAVRLTTLIGLAHYGLGEYAAAVLDLRVATEHDPQNLPFRLALAHSCLWSKQYQCVLDEYREILTLNPESAEAYMLAGEALDEMKDNAGAVEQFRAAVKADPREPNVHFGLAYLLWGLMKYEEAAQEFQAELANNPDHAQALTYLADTNMQLSHSDAAMPLLLKALKIDPSITLAHVDLGLLYSEAGRKDEALAELKLAESLSPNDVNVHWRLARFYQAAGKKEEANAEFEKTRGLQRSADASIMTKLKDAQDKGNPAGSPDGSAAVK
jgi:tetratricopeptide (TPR) repeat protein